MGCVSRWQMSGVVLRLWDLHFSCFVLNSRFGRRAFYACCDLLFPDMQEAPWISTCVFPRRQFALGRVVLFIHVLEASAWHTSFSTLNAYKFGASSEVYSCIKLNVDISLILGHLVPAQGLLYLTLLIMIWEVWQHNTLTQWLICKFYYNENQK